MDIDHHTQSRYTVNKPSLFIEMDGKFIRETSYNEIENITRDISYVRHESTNFISLYAGQFDFERMLSLPYWEFLFLKGDINKGELINIQDGCLLMIALFYIEIYDDVGDSYIHSNDLFKILENAIITFLPITERQKEVLKNITILMQFSEDRVVLSQLSQGNPDQKYTEIEKKIGESNQLIYNELVEQYFWETAKGFEVLREKCNEMHKTIMNNQKKF